MTEVHVSGNDGKFTVEELKLNEEFWVFTFPFNLFLSIFSANIICSTYPPENFFLNVFLWLMLWGVFYFTMDFTILFAKILLYLSNKENRVCETSKNSFKRDKIFNRIFVFICREKDHGHCIELCHELLISSSSSQFCEKHEEGGGTGTGTPTGGKNLND